VAWRNRSLQFSGGEKVLRVNHLQFKSLLHHPFPPAHFIAASFSDLHHPSYLPSFLYHLCTLVPCPLYSYYLHHDRLAAVSRCKSSLTRSCDLLANVNASSHALLQSPGYLRLELHHPRYGLAMLPPKPLRAPRRSRVRSLVLTWVPPTRLSPLWKGSSLA
jgi:hypothetical protein